MWSRRSIKLGGAAVIAVGIAVVALIAVGANDGGGDPIRPRSAADVNRLLEGIPQQGLALGEPSALVTLIEFGDLQCSACKAYAEKAIPQIIENQVRDGEAKLSFHASTIVGPQSAAAAAAAIAAGEQGRGWNFVELFYLEQGTESSGYATDEFLTAIARRAGVHDLARWNRERKGERIHKLVESNLLSTESHGFTDSPTFVVLGPGNYDEFQEPVKTTGSARPLEAAIAEQTSGPNAEELIPK